MHRHSQKHMDNWIQELRGFGVHQGEDGRALEDLDYYEIRSLVVREQLRNDLEVKASPWF